MSRPSATQPAYTPWVEMRRRCRSGGRVDSVHYVDRGISVCPQWASFAVFLRDMGPRPSPKHSLDRIDNSLGYEPGNVRWATAGEQMRNTRRTRFIEANGERLCLVRNGWAPVRAVTQPRRKP